VSKKELIQESDALFFVDTNILLDFYRIRKSNISLKYLEQLEVCKDRLIVGSQIEMEYKKNRQRVILDSLNQFSKPEWGKLSPPTIVSSLQASKMLESYCQEITKQYNKINGKIQKILTNPQQNDPVFQVLQRLFNNNSPYNLNRNSNKRFKVRQLARKRFCLGYPPRKPNDNSIGDSINWEWIIQCAIDSGRNIVIITRDSDYGVIYKDQSYLNDWLKQEFKQRVSRNRKIILVNKLSEGLRIIHANVTREMEEAEQQLIKNRQVETTYSIGNYMAVDVE
jgi:hypothetical protein